MQVDIDLILKTFNISCIDKHPNNSVEPGSFLKTSNTRIYWLKSVKYYDKFTSGFLIVSKSDYENIRTKNENIYHIVVSNKKPRLVFSEILSTFFEDEPSYRINDVEKHRLNNDIYIGDNVFIGLDVNIGKNTVILNNSVINKGTIIGENCTIKENCTIGTEGMGYELHDEEWVKFPQLGGVIIERNVTFGPHSTIRRAALDNTIIRSGCKIGSFVNIGHNCEIGKNTMLTSQCVIGGSTKLGDNVYMGIQSCVRNALVIGDDITIGHGTVVTKSFLDQKTTLIGNPAELMDTYKKWSTIRKGMLEE